MQQQNVHFEALYESKMHSYRQMQHKANRKTKRQALIHHSQHCKADRIAQIISWLSHICKTTGGTRAALPIKTLSSEEVMTCFHTDWEGWLGQNSFHSWWKSLPCAWFKSSMIFFSPENDGCRDSHINHVLLWLLIIFYDSDSFKNICLQGQPHSC